MTGPLTILLDKILSTGTYPQNWTAGIITPIHKREIKTTPQTTEVSPSLVASENFSA